ncbi:flagellar biosynthesis protein FliR [Pelagimonas phthalicica]|uniref:Flagellar biosynthesis protein FliR n=1 Tax=Pelagimonas phthalicica TaxID=1037362 RepID=A0A238J6C4_9RHOB|nr:flagellar biosynthetic protein FliR [Pelagimonas phthalicica]TDS95337.1 flagellar biosynthetic protein FliR [Pelagimonas phthalicica]SMX26139.1 flagellar biosynthesis protein FliR [Pelagimonas phthalicica]
MTTLLPLTELTMGSLWFYLLVFLRVSAAVSVMPAMGEQMISVRIKMVVALMMTAVVTPVVVAKFAGVEPSLSTFLQALATETLAGLFLGLALRMFMLAIQTAGAIAAQSTSLAQLLGQSGLDPLPALGNILAISALALLMVTGFHVKAIAYLVLSYEIMPAFTIPNPADVAEAGSQQVMRSFALAFTLAAPFVILSVLYNLTLGVINKAMPQLMVAFVGAPVITFGAIAFLLVSAPLMLTVWVQAMDRFLAAPFR